MIYVGILYIPNLIYILDTLHRIVTCKKLFGPMQLLFFLLCYQVIIKLYIKNTRKHQLTNMLLFLLYYNAPQVIYNMYIVQVYDFFKGSICILHILIIAT